MAAAYVPPPPEDTDFLDFSTQQLQGSLSYEDHSNYALPKKRPARGQLQPAFGGEGFFKPNGQPYFNLQRVPETPALHPKRQRLQTPHTEDCRLNFSFDSPSAPGSRSHIGLRSVTEIPEQYRDVFKYSHFNYVQSKVFDDIMYTDSPVVTSAPTGSGKTVIFELAIIRLLMQAGERIASTKIIYVAPIKALCSERFEDWQQKFGPLGLRCCELTGDSQLDDYFVLQNAQIVMTTPEKWDSMTRKWRDNKSLVQLVKLFMIDEVHQLNDEGRGATMEAIVSRMKTIQSSLMWEEGGGRGGIAGSRLRLIAVSATIPNIADVAAWLGSGEECPALQYNIDESHRPVRLRRVVLGYPDATSEFKFDLSLNYRLSGVVQCYSDQKPTLVFCATRKGTQQAANTLVKDARFVMNSQHKQRLLTAANSTRDNKLRELVVYGVGYHHAGMDVADRKAIETMFTAGDLPVLFATSTLAMGVNLPAHLVVIKSTMHYIAGVYQECSESQILQMIGRAGRPQFDTSATAVIMTRNSTKTKYEALVSGNQLIESNLHRNLIEHLNAEIVLNTITDVSIALEWLRSTFFYIRVKQNPQHYGMPEEHEQMEEKLQQLCLSHLNMLESSSLIKMEDGFALQPRETGRLMARYYVAFESMKRLLNLKGTESLAELVSELSQCREFEEVRLRVSEKKVLNTLNKDKNRPTIRFPMVGKIKSTDMKVNCLIQATLGCLPVQEFALNQDTQKIFRGASRLSKCLMELQIIGDNFPSLLNAVLLHKCIQARLWENSKHVAKQLDKIGLTLSTTLVNAGLTTFKKILEKSPRELELIMNRHPPFGNQIHDAVAKLPQYALSVEQSSGLSSSHCEVTVTVLLSNHALMKEVGGGVDHTSMLLIGDTNNKVVCKQRISDSQLMSRGQFTRRLSVQRATNGDELTVHFVSLDRVGLDIQETYTPQYSTPAMTGKRQISSKNDSHHDKGLANRSKPVPPPSTATAARGRQEYRKSCNHRCVNKAVCGHECCKSGVLVKAAPPPSNSAKAASSRNSQLSGTKRRGSNPMEDYVNELHARASTLPETPSALRRLKPSLSINSAKRRLNDRFGYKPPPSMKPSNTDISSDEEFALIENNSIVPDNTPGYGGAWSPHNLRKSSDDIGGSMVPSDFEDFDDEIESYQDDFFTACKSTELSPSFSSTVPQRLVFQHPASSSRSSGQYQFAEQSKQFSVYSDYPPPGASRGKERMGGQQHTSASSRMRAKSMMSQIGGVFEEQEKSAATLQSHLSGKKRLIDEVYEDSSSPGSKGSQLKTKQSRISSTDRSNVTLCKPAELAERNNLSFNRVMDNTPLGHTRVERKSSLQVPVLSDTISPMAKKPTTLSRKLSTQLNSRLPCQPTKQPISKPVSQPTYFTHNIVQCTSDVVTNDDLSSNYTQAKTDTISRQMPPKTTYSFFTAHAGHDSPEEEGDIFGSVFAGIF